MENDAKAFAQLMKYIKEYDPYHTVIMIQVQNEPGTWDSVRDYSKSVDKLFNSRVPKPFLALLSCQNLAQARIAEHGVRSLETERTNTFMLGV